MGLVAGVETTETTGAETTETTGAETTETTRAETTETTGLGAVTHIFCSDDNN